MAVLINRLPVSIPSGTREIGPVAIPNNLTTMTLRVARATTATPTLWSLAATASKADIFVSFDGGVTFAFIAGFGAVGGVHVKKDGTQASESTLRCAVRRAPNRQMKASLTVTNGPLVSEVTVEVT